MNNQELDRNVIIENTENLNRSEKQNITNRKETHSEKMRRAWRSGKFKNRNEKYKQSKIYKEKVSFSVKKLWDSGVYTPDRNKKISIAHKGKYFGKRGRKDYIHKCKICGVNFVNKRQHRYICDNENCQSKKSSLRMIDPEVEKSRRLKISNAMKGKIPKNLMVNINNKSSPKQIELYNIVKKYYPSAKYNLKIFTGKTNRWLDVAVESLKIDFEYNGKCHLMKNIIKKDIIRKKEIESLGWKIIVFDRNNFENADFVIRKIKENGDL